MRKCDLVLGGAPATARGDDVDAADAAADATLARVEALVLERTHEEPRAWLLLDDGAADGGAADGGAADGALDDELDSRALHDPAFWASLLDAPGTDATLPRSASCGDEELSWSGDAELAPSDGAASLLETVLEPPRTPPAVQRAPQRSSQPSDARALGDDLSAMLDELQSESPSTRSADDAEPDRDGCDGRDGRDGRDDHDGDARAAPPAAAPAPPQTDDAQSRSCPSATDDAPREAMTEPVADVDAPPALSPCPTPRSAEERADDERPPDAGATADASASEQQDRRGVAHIQALLVQARARLARERERGLGARAF